MREYIERVHRHDANVNDNYKSTTATRNAARAHREMGAIFKPIERRQRKSKITGDGNDSTASATKIYRPRDGICYNINDIKKNIPM